MIINRKAIIYMLLAVRCSAGEETFDQSHIQLAQRLGLEFFKIKNELCDIAETIGGFSHKICSLIKEHKITGDVIKYLMICAVKGLVAIAAPDAVGLKSELSGKNAHDPDIKAAFSSTDRISETCRENFDVAGIIHPSSELMNQAIEEILSESLQQVIKDIQANPVELIKAKETKAAKLKSLLHTQPEQVHGEIELCVVRLEVEYVKVLEAIQKLYQLSEKRAQMPTPLQDLANEQTKFLLRKRADLRPLEQIIKTGEHSKSLFLEYVEKLIKLKLTVESISKSEDKPDLMRIFYQIGFVLERFKDKLTMDEQMFLVKEIDSIHEKELTTFRKQIELLSRNMPKLYELEAAVKAKQFHKSLFLEYVEKLIKFKLIVESIYESEDKPDIMSIYHKIGHMLEIFRHSLTREERMFLARKIHSSHEKESRTFS